MMSQEGEKEKEGIGSGDGEEDGRQKQGKSSMGVKEDVALETGSREIRL